MGSIDLVSFFLPLAVKCKCLGGGTREEDDDGLRSHPLTDLDRSQTLK